MVKIENIENKGMYIKCNVCNNVLSFDEDDIEHLIYYGSSVIECPHCKSLVTVKK